MRARLLNVIRNESGASAVEYALVAGLIAAVIVTAVGLFGDSVLALFTYSSTEIEKLGGAGA